MDALRRLIIEHRPRVRRALLVAAVAVPLLFATGTLVVDGWAARRFLLLIVALTAEATWYKLVVWRDPRSWALGIAAGAALAAARVLINRTFPVPTTIR